MAAPTRLKSNVFQVVEIAGAVRGWYMRVGDPASRAGSAARAQHVTSSGAEGGR